MRHRLPLLDVAAASMHAQRVSLASDYESTLLGALAEARGHMSCEKGCASCCYYPISISLLEGRRLFTALVDSGRWTPSLKRKCQTLSERLIALAPQVWLLSMTPCPLLDDANACMAYEERPFYCRTALATDGSEGCHPHRTLENRGPFPRTDALEEFRKVEGQEMQKLGVSRVLVPIATALLVAERVEAEGCDIERAYDFVFKSYEKARHP